MLQILSRRDPATPQYNGAQTGLARFTLAPWKAVTHLNYMLHNLERHARTLRTCPMSVTGYFTYVEPFGQGAL
jgi:hypothetical protein